MASRKSLVSFLRQSFQQLGFKGTLAKQNSEAMFRHSGLSYNDLHQGSPSVWKVLQLVESSLHYAAFVLVSTNGGTLADLPDLLGHGRAFVMSTIVDITQHMYDRNIVKTPLDVKVFPYHIGEKSFSLQCKAFVHNDEKLLLTNITRLIFVDPSTRKAKVLPDWWKDKYTAAATSSEPCIIPQSPKPEDARAYDLYVQGSDTDINFHTNWCSYVKFCIDADTAGNLKNRSKGTPAGTIRGRHVRKVAVQYTGESRAGDQLRVYSWQSDQFDNSVHFQICKGESAISFATVDYFSPSALVSEREDT